MMTNSKKNRGGKKRKGKKPLFTPLRSEFYYPEHFKLLPLETHIFNSVVQFIHCLGPDNNLTYARVVFFPTHRITPL